jgi:hypothetical protein
MRIDKFPPGLRSTMDIEAGRTGRTLRRDDVSSSVFPNGRLRGAGSNASPMPLKGGSSTP